MSTPLFLLLGLTIATCVIAYWSDNLGKKLGKKRVSLFGLRPRQTATLMTMSSSVVIMLFTLGALLATNSGLRNALLRYDKERADNRDLRQKNSNLRTEQRQLQLAQQQLQTEVKSAQSQASGAKKQASGAKKQAQVAQKQAQDAYQKYNAAQSDLTEQQKQLRFAKVAEQRAQKGEQQARNSEKTAKERADKARSDLQAKQTKLNEVNFNLKSAQASLQKLQAQLQNAQNRLAQAQNKLAQTQNKLAQAGTKYFEESKKSLDFARDLWTQITQRQKEIADLKTQKVSLEQDINGLKDSLRHLNEVKIKLAQPSRGDVDVLEGAFYADRLIPARSDDSEIAEQLRAMLKEGNAEVARENKKRTIQLLLQTGEELPQEVIVKSLAQFLAGQNVPASVRLTALRYHVNTETEIQCAFLVVFARLAFTRNEVLAAKTIDGSQSDARIFNQLLHGLLDAGENAAKKQGVLPILRGEEKLYVEGTNERVFEALRRIQSVGKPVEVRLVADDNLTTIDQLRVHFQVGKMDGSL